MNLDQDIGEDRAMTVMFRQNLADFMYYLKHDLALHMHELQEVFYKHSFESPLNFIMVRSDFKRFYESFLEAKLSLLYSLELHKDSMFNLKALKHSLDLSKFMFKNFQAQVAEMSDILEEYFHLVQHDNFDCKNHFSGKEMNLKCVYKKYGFSFVLLAILSAYGYWTIKRELSTKKVE